MICLVPKFQKVSCRECVARHLLVGCGVSDSLQVAQETVYIHQRAAGICDERSKWMKAAGVE
ncbi:hypothetical protein PHLCEN_2v7844 [Hermanssonia centrifuga]|uniref:Uncharacterized protein n=1 Tax=Hermanssonia centrifuga TaxID=98765 RepID=A0A2R6NVE2_9APHY|nr:hypothetical protein PHLCEN_2v7844 [Hermanssonia centrifuga]